MRVTWFSSMGSTLLAAAATFALVMHVTFIEVFHSARLGVVLILLLFIHCLRYQQLLFSREFMLYSLFVTYMILQLFWTNDRLLAMNTIEPAIIFVIIMLLFGSLVRYHSVRAILIGQFAGFATGAAVYTIVAGFPFERPADFSYNAIALTYLYGLFITMLLSRHVRSVGLLSFAGLIFILHLVATTSIKVNLGILLGAAVAGIFYFRDLVTTLRRNVLPLAIFGGALAFAIMSNNVFLVILRAGTARISLGVELLQARTDLPGYTGLLERFSWMGDAVEGWLQNPVFGYGVEAFRAGHGITSHSSAIDILYNSGLIGSALFYSMFLSILWRLLSVRHADTHRVRPLIFATMVCYLFITMSGNVHYDVFLAAFVGTSVALLAGRLEEPVRGSENSPLSWA